MNTDEHGLKEKELTGQIIKIFYDVYNELGHGFLESVYEASMAIALGSVGLSAVRQPATPVYFRGHLVGEFKADLLVEAKVIVEIKAVRAIDSSHEAQILNFLRATPMEVGLLMNFGPKPEFKRFLFDNPRKQIRVDPCPSVADSSV